jgi:aminoglycoside phosphotransferase family enzyme/predicted kinase
MSSDPIPPDAARLIEALADPAAYPHPVGTVRLIETHISWVLLTGRFAYKVKKPVDLGFVDYTTLERRRHFCEEEVRLNRRLAPDVYLGVVPITGDPAHPKVGGEGEAFEYAVRMREFPQDAQLDRALARGTVGPDEVDELADTLARFHAEARVARPGDGYGGPEQVAAAIRANFTLTEPFVGKGIDPERYRHLADWSEAVLARNRDRITARLADGFVRECHGDAHLRNIALVEGRIEIFDCIEFNPAFRFTDVMAEIAFTRMDFDVRGRTDLGWRVLNRYLEMGGDYAGLALLPMYLSYRAYVRAKVALLGPETPERADVVARQVDLADAYTRPGRPALLVMHGVTGTGKSTVSSEIIERLGAIRIRSDAERKRLAGAARGHRPGGVGAGIYSADMTRATYDRLHELAEAVLAAGYSVVLDATYLKRWQREAARDVARRAGVPWLIVHCRAPREELIYRIEARAEEAGTISDATVDVLHAQLKAAEPLEGEEAGRVVLVDTDGVDPAEVPDLVRGALEGMPGASGSPGRQVEA